MARAAKSERRDREQRDRNQEPELIEKLVGIQQQKSDCNCGQQIKGKPVAVKIARDAEECESRGGAYAGSAPAGHHGVDPHHSRSNKEREALRYKADAQQEQEERGQDGYVGAGYDQRVECAGVAVVLGPNALQLVVLSDQDGLYHRRAVSIAGIERSDARERGGPKVHHKFLQRRSASAR